MRVPTYANYMNAISSIRDNRANVDKYSYQSVSGLKYEDYSGYGMKAYNIVSMEATLQVTNTFMENNELANISLNTANLSVETILDALADMKSMLNSLYGANLGKIAPDSTGGELTFLSDTSSDYVGKTLTISGTTYTFTNGDDTGTNINVSGLGKEAIMEAVATRTSSAGVKYTGGKLTFPLYTINGKSTLLDDESLVQKGEAHEMNAEQSLMLQNVQRQAFSTMQLLSDTLNTNTGGKYIFGGGSTNEPVSFPFASLSEFQSYYDGVNVIYPSSSAAVLSNYSVDYSKTGDLQFVKDPGTQGYHTITAKTGSFLEEAIAMNDANVGKLVFDGGANSMKAFEYGAFSSLHVGDSIVISGTGDSTDIKNDKAYVIQSVSEDGRTVIFDNSETVENMSFDSPTGIVVSKTFPKGSVINLNDFGVNSLAPSATVVGISNDGKTLKVKADNDRFPDMTSSGSRWSISSETYYQGGTLKYNQRISESQTISFDVTASDPAFEKIFRALGQLSQGNIVDLGDPAKGAAFDPQKTERIIEDAMALLTSATSGVDDISKQANSSLYSITAKLNADYSILSKVMKNQKLAVANLEDNIGNIKDADKDEAGVKLLMASQALEASYTILSSVSKLSLLDYIK